MDRTIMPDGTIVTTVTTIQSRPKADCKLGEAALRQESCQGGVGWGVFLRLFTQAAGKLFSHCMLWLLCTLRIGWVGGAFSF